MSWMKIFGNSSIRVKDEDCTDELVQKQSSNCKEKYMKWKRCTSHHGYNNCKEEQLEDYYKCVDKLNAMRIYLENRA